MALITQYKTASLDETFNVAARLGERLTTNAVVLFYGDLGAGKTTFIKGLASAAQIPKSSVVSPTFSLLNIYQGTKSLFHFDLYRLKDLRDFIDLGFDDYLEPEGITCIEWPSRIQEILPDSCFEVHIEHLSENERLITIKEGL